LSIVKILHIDSGIQGANSLSRDMSAKVVARLREAHPDASVKYLDLGKNPTPHLTEDALPLVFGQQEGSGDPPSEPALSRKILADFLAADCVVIGAGFYNLTVTRIRKSSRTSSSPIRATTSVWACGSKPTPK